MLHTVKQWLPTFFLLQISKQKWEYFVPLWVEKAFYDIFIENLSLNLKYMKNCQTLSWEPLLYITSDPMNVVRNNGPLSNTFFLRCTINDAKGGFGKSVEAIVNVDA